MAPPLTTPITALTNLPADNISPDDLLVIVDVSDPTQAPTGTTKNITVYQLSRGWNATVNAILDNGGAVLDATVSCIVRCPRGTIIDAELVSETSGSVSVEVYHATYPAFPTFTKISASAPLAIVSGTKYDDATLTGWTTDVEEGDYLKFVVTSATTIPRAYAALTLVRN